MNKTALDRLFAMLPDGKRKEELVAKYNRVQTQNSKQERGGNGLIDSFELTPKGHIRIEAIDEHGNVLDTLADQANLVVDGAEEILLRAFSGDPNRTLYKNRIPKVNPTDTIYIEEAKLSGQPLFDGDQLLQAPNVLWSAVNDDHFDVSFGFYPVTVYVKEVPSTEYGKKAFVLSKTAGTGFLPLTAEIYSGFTNLFIGLGEGKNIPVALTDARLTNNGFTVIDGVAIADTTGDEITFTEKISNLELEVETSREGGTLEIYVNGALRETVDTYIDSDLPTGIFVTVDQLDNETATAIRLVHAGTSHEVVAPEITIKQLRFDALTKQMNGLFKEFKNFETEFLTPATFNTTPMGPYTIQLPNYPLKADSVGVTYEGTVYTEVDTEAELTDTTFVVDEARGILTFNRALTGVSITYSVTGEIYDTELAATMTGTTVSYNTTREVPVNEIPTGVVNGANKTFTLSHADIKEGTVVAKADGAVIEIATIDYENQKITLVDAVATGVSVTVEYIYTTVDVTSTGAVKYKAQYTITEGVKVFDQNGAALIEVDTAQEFGNGTFMISEDKDGIILPDNVTKIEVIYKSVDKPGFETNYKRAVIEKPKSINEYPWFELDKGAVRFVAEFPELSPAYNITIREMALFDGPRADDKIAGFRNYPVKAFSLVRVGETRKDANTGIRITWTITLLNSQSEPFQGGRN